MGVIECTLPAVTGLKVASMTSLAAGEFILLSVLDLFNCPSGKLVGVISVQGEEILVTTPQTLVGRRF